MNAALVITEISEEMEADIALTKRAIAGIVGAIDEAARVMSEMCRKHPGFIVEMHKAMKNQIGIGYLRRLQRVGDGELHPRLCLCVGPAQPYVEKLSLADQERVLDGIEWPEGDSYRILQLADLDYTQASCAFRGGAIADRETIFRRVTLARAKLDGKIQQHREYVRGRDEQDQEDIALVTSFGVEIKDGVLVIPRSTRVSARAFATWLGWQDYPV